ncbi:sensor histidine kinase [Dokdonia sp.]|uniref:sensor histidine kinase n=1 Tax=Dokdonia sp. TaxID=2024995 RepID=UPI003266B711
MYTICSQAQDTPQNHKIYDSKDGFLVDNVSAMLFDNDGWLWIAGHRSNPNEFKIESDVSILQRYNGNSFHTIDLPNIKSETFSNAVIKKRQDGNIYVHIQDRQKNKYSQLFLLNPKTLVSKEIILPIDHINIKDNYELTLYPYKDDFILFINTNERSFIYTLDSNLTFTLLQEIPNKKNVLASQFMGFDDHFIINDDRSGILTFDTKGNLLNTLDAEDLGVDKNLIDYNLNINSLFIYNGSYHANFFSGTEDYFSYDPQKRVWIQTFIFQDLRNKKNNANKIHNDLYGNVLRFDSFDTKSGIQMSRYLNALDHPDFTYSINLPRVPVFTSRNFEKEVFIGESGQLHHIVFESSNFSLFLRNYSIRGILPLNNKKILVSTENNGWYILNPKTKEITPYKLTLNGQPYIADENRGFFKTQNGFWSTYNKGIVHVDDTSRELETYIHYPVSSMIEDSTSIYYGTHKYNLMRFDKVTKKHHALTKTDTLDIQVITKKDGIIYGATGDGLLVYHNKKATIHKPTTTIDGNFLLSIKNTKPYGLLMGSRSGELFYFDTETLKFKTIYQDPLKASIASFLLDNHDRIWLNTFSGIIAFDPSDQSMIRYGESDGLSHFESNRYSAAKTEDGYFLVGTLRGLNYFHPDSISKNKIDALLELSSVTYFDKKTKARKRELSSEKLNTLTSITLPAEHRNINLEFGLLGMFINETVNYRYRFNQEEWNNLGRENLLNLVSLAPGNYDLEVEALDSSQQKIGESLYLHIHAKNFIYKSFWFYLSLIILLGAIGFWYILQLKKRHNLKEQFATQLINTQENERSRIAKELHDSIGQKLLLLKNTLLLKNESIDNSIPLVEDTIHEVREMSHNLHPFQFEQLGLTQALHNVIDAFQKTSPIFFSADIDEIEGLIAKEKEIFIFRMLQECISNVIKHSKATACNLNVSKNEKNILFQLKDNGIGFESEFYENSVSNLGLRTLKERAQFINAQLRIVSIPQKGTTITITVPLL